MGTIFFATPYWYPHTPCPRTRTRDGGITQKSLSSKKWHSVEFKGCVNQSKTDVMLMLQGNEWLDVKIAVSNEISQITSKKVKALNVWFDHKLKWDVHIWTQKKISRNLQWFKIHQKEVEPKISHHSCHCPSSFNIVLSFKCLANPNFK